MNKYLEDEVYEIVWLVVYVGLVTGIFTLFFGLGGGGFEKDVILQKNMFYIGYGVLFLIGIIGLKIAGIFVFGKKHANIDGTITHDPEQSVLPKWKVFKNTFLLAFFCIILFSLLGWLASRYQTFFNAVPNYEQQFTKGADLFFSVYPASPCETLGALFLISLLGLFLGIMIKKGKLSKLWFLVLFLIGAPIISLIYGIINHLMRYGGQDVAMSSVAMFWFIGGLLTAITGSVIPFLLMHDINNFYYRFSTLFGNEIVTTTTFLVIGLLTVLFLFILFKGRKKNENT